MYLSFIILEKGCKEMNGNKVKVLVESKCCYYSIHYYNKVHAM